MKTTPILIFLILISLITFRLIYLDNAQAAKIHDLKMVIGKLCDAQGLKVIEANDGRLFISQTHDNNVLEDEEHWMPKPMPRVHDWSTMKPGPMGTVPVSTPSGGIAWMLLPRPYEVPWSMELPPKHPQKPDPYAKLIKWMESDEDRAFPYSPYMIDIEPIKP